MTSFFTRNGFKVTLYDTRVIVDNFVETVDFSENSLLWIKKCQLVRHRILQVQSFKMKKILIQSIYDSFILTESVYTYK